MNRRTLPLALGAALMALVCAPTWASADNTQKTSTYYEVQLPERPQRRVWCAFRQVKEGGTRMVTFDPSVGDGLSQTIGLPGGQWEMRCFAEPVTVVVEGDDEVRSFDLSWTFEPSEWVDVDTRTPFEVMTTRMDPDGISAAESKITGQIRVFKIGRPSLAETARNLATTAGGATGGRSLDDTVPALVTDTLNLLAEIALERARGRAEALILRPLVRLACDRGPGSDDARDALVQILASTSVSGEPDAAEALLKVLLPTDQPRLPSTCAAIDGRTLAQLAESGAEVADALGRDLLRLGKRLVAHAAKHHLKAAGMPQTAKLVEHALDRIESTLARVVTTGALPTPTEVQLILVALAHDTADLIPKADKPDADKPDADQPDLAAICSAALAFAVAADCHGAGERCDARTIAEKVANPAKAFKLDGCEGALTASLKDTDLDWLPGWVARLSEVLMPPSGSTPRDQARLAVDLTFELIEHTVRPDDAKANDAKANDAKANDAKVNDAKVNDAKVNNAKAIENARNRRFAADMAQGLRTLSLGLIDQDGGQAIIGGVELVRVLIGRAEQTLVATSTCTPITKTSGTKTSDTKRSGPEKPACPAEAQRRAVTTLIWLRRSRHALTRAVRIGSALADNARSLKVATADPTQAESQRQARKQTLESLIDASTDRRWRGEDWVLSLGAGVGGVIAPPDLRPDGEDRWIALGLTGGLALQKLVPQDGWWGWHTQLVLADLGYFLSIDEETEVQWNDFVVLGFQVGGIVAPSPDDAFIFGVDLRYLPGGRFARQTQLSLFIGYYVPFFDLN